MNDLIDEQELRDAFESLRPERDAFEAGVRSRLNAMPQRETASRLGFEDSPWLQVAASMVPLSLFGKAAGTSSAIPLGKVSLGYKLVGYAALPTLSVLFMVGATLLALFRIRKAHISPCSDSMDAAEQESAILLKWWKSFGLIPVCLSFVALVVFLLGYTFPVFIFFLGSGIAMVTLVTRLGRTGLIDRSTVGGTMISSLVGLAQATQIISIVDSGRHLLDQGLVTMTLLLAAMLLGVMLTIGKWNGWQSVEKTVGLVIAAVLVVGFFGASIWYPMSTQKMKNHVEAFDRARFSSVSWKRWAVPTVWLQKSGVPLDLSKPRGLLQVEIAGEQNPFILGVASRTGLVVPAELSRVRDPFDRRKLLMIPYFRDQAILSIEQLEFAIRELVMLGQWHEGELDLLESRLLATIRRSVTPESDGLSEGLVATKILEVIGRPCTDGSIRQLMHQQLVAMQRTRFNLGGRNGGFATYPTLDHSDLLSTSSAVELMEHYGVPSDLNLMALRSFLRPAMIDSWMTDEAAIRAATRMRLQGLAQVPPLTWWDYVRHEESIAMAIVFAMLCFFATLGCPNRSVVPSPLINGMSRSRIFDPVASIGNSDDQVDK